MGKHYSQRGGRPHAFTLVELLVVLVILSIALFIITPRFVSFVNPERAKNFILGLQNTLNYLGEKAILEKRIYLFHFDLDERRYYFTVSEGENPSGAVTDRYLRAGEFPQKLNVERIAVVPGDVFYDGEVAIPFTPNGILFSFEIYFLGDDETRYVLSGNSINSRIELFKIKNESREIFE
jgi:prepilin-type N-terminal cleavage/methylation domain-containing protein